MKTKILNINIPEPFPADYDPLLGKSCSEYFGSVHRISGLAKPKNTGISVFDSVESFSNSKTSQVPTIANDISPPEENISSLESENLTYANTVPIETVTFDNKSEKDFNVYEQHEIFSSESSSYTFDENEIIKAPETLESEQITELVTENIVTDNAPYEPSESLEYEDISKDFASSLDAKAPKDFDSFEPHELISKDLPNFTDDETETTSSEAPIPQETENESLNTLEETHLIEESDETDFKNPNDLSVLSAEDVANILEDENPKPPTPIEAPKSEEVKKPKQKLVRAKKPRQKSKSKKPVNLGYMFGGIFFTGLGALLLGTSMLAPLGAPFDDISSLSWYWFAIALIGFVFWIGTRRIPWIIISGLIGLIYLTNTVPWMGVAPKGGNKNRHTIGFANIENDDKAYTAFVKEAEKNDAEILMLANASRLKSAPEGWNLVIAAIENDPTSLAVIAKADWHANLNPGEPTIAKPADNWFSLIGTNPKDPSTTKRTTPEREALINRTANRAGMEEGAVLVVGDFAATPWDRAMQDFTKTSSLTRVRCGGYLGTTFSKGIFGLAFDHVYFKGLNVQACKIGPRLHKSNHSPIFVSVAPKASK